MPHSEFCTDCGATLHPSADGTDCPPCPVCGSVRRTIGASINESAVARDGLRLRAKRQGEKGFYTDRRTEPSYSADLQKMVHLERIIDHDANLYSEKVTTYEDQRVIHECHEALSDHQGHGSAKPKAAT